jgi:hypothetical protein
MHLIHSTYCDGAIVYKILREGKLLSSKKTNNTTMHGTPSNYIFFSFDCPEKGISQEFRGSAMFHFKYSLLADKCWYFQTHWKGEESLDSAIKIDCSQKKCTKRAIKRIFEEVLYKIIKKNFKKQLSDWKKRTGKSRTTPSTLEIIHSHEVLIKDKVPLKPYLYKIEVDISFGKYKEKIKRLLKKHYPEVELVVLP